MNEQNNERLERLKKCEDVLGNRDDIEYFHNRFQALATIYVEKLWIEKGSKDFHDYVKNERHIRSDQHFGRLLKAVQLWETEPVGSKPTTERNARAILEQRQKEQKKNLEPTGSPVSKNGEPKTEDEPDEF